MSAIDHLKSLSKVQVSFIAFTSAMSALGGAVIGAKVAIDRLGAELREAADKELQEEIAKAKEFYSVLHKKKEFETPEQALEALHPEALTVAVAARALQNYKGQNLDPRPELKEVTKNVFTDAKYIQEPFDYEEELKRRDPERPYLITEDEFIEAGPNYDQVEFTYYEGDGVLTNAQDDMVENLDIVVGNDNLMRFGHGSNDENIVYVRNVEMEMDIHIVRSPGKFSVEVAGFNDDDSDLELRHSGYRKFRDRDQ